ncbi:hypothetical protein [Streptomyces sp. NPDC005181]|uniref:hypothetical protein n=1 Tax=Streptomyces sp. NPDC005181 TaxID=3156869 RepID=UPI0033A45DB7
MIGYEISKSWAVVHDNTRIPSLRRLYMTATPRLWQLGDEEAGGQEQQQPGASVPGERSRWPSISTGLQP